MTKYRLKDQELQKHLDAISGGEFTATIESGSFELDEDDMAVVTFGSSMHGTKIIAGKFSVILHKNETYELAKYNPNNWNNYPDVTPPEGVWMRVEAQRVSTGEISRVCAIFRDGRWHLTEQGTAVDLVEFAGTKKVKRYRPWEGAMVWHKWPDKKPPELIELLVTHKTEKGELRIDKACFDPDEGWEGIIDMVGDVLAWAELPEPYIPD